MNNIYIIAHYKRISIRNLILFSLFFKIINLFLSSMHYAIHLYSKRIVSMPFYYSQFYFLTNNDTRSIYFSLSIVYILIMQLILRLAPLVRASLFITRPSISYCSFPM